MKLHIPPALLHRRFRLLWIGLTISVAGSRMQFWALLWHIRSLTDQPIALGLVGLSRVVPIIIFSLIGGAVADVFDRRKILFVTQGIQTLNAFVLGFLTLTGQIQLWHLYLLTVIEGITFSFDLPARQSLTPNLVPAKDLPNAFSLQSIAFTTGNILGPALSGLVLATPFLGQAYAYLFNAVSYLAIFWALIGIGPVEQQRDAGGGRIDFQAIGDGVRFIRKQPLIMATMLLDFFATFFSSAFALLPIYAVDILNVGELGYGLLSSAAFIGAAIAAAVVSQIGEMRRQGPVLLISVVIYGLATVGFGLSRTYVWAFIALMFVGAGDSVSTIIRNTIRQLQTPDNLRGRMTSINQIFFMGGPQLGELEAGLVAQFFGAPAAVITGGIACIAGVGWVARRWPGIRSYNGDEPILAGASAD